MIRFIIKRNWRAPFSHNDTIGHETVDIDVPELERILLGGGFGENGHDIRELLGVEILPEPCDCGRVQAIQELEGMAKRFEGACVWSTDPDDDGAMWEGSCGIAWTFIEGGMEDNDVKFCPRCGRKAVVLKDDDEAALKEDQ